MTRLQSPGQDNQESSEQRISPPCNTCSCPDTQDARTEAVDHKTDCLNDDSADREEDVPLQILPVLYLFVIQNLKTWIQCLNEQNENIHAESS